jgi:uncharacterized protein (DUF433 family)
MDSEYIEQRDGGYYLAGIRVSLDSIVYAFNEGRSPEAIQEEFPSVRPSQIYGAIAFYLDHKDEVDSYLAATEREFEAGGMPMAQADPALWERIERARAKSGGTRV